MNVLKSNLIWIIVIAGFIISIIRFYIFHRKLIGILKKGDRELFKKVLQTITDYRYFIFHGPECNDENIEYYRIQTREALKLSLLFVGIFLLFMLAVAFGK